MHRICISTLLALAVMGSPSMGAPTNSAPMQDSSIDLIDIGGGTAFDCNAAGQRNLSGGFPWAVNAGANLYDNNTASTCHTQWNSTPSPAYVGVYGMTTAYQLGGFAITTGPIWQNGYQFTIQGSNDSTNGWEGTWTDIYVSGGATLTGETTYRWWADENTFLSEERFTCFRLVEASQYKRYAEVEFFAPPPLVGMVVLLY